MMKDSRPEPLVLTTPRKDWVAAELGRIIDEWYAWRVEVDTIVDHPYDKNTHSEVYADGEENMSKHAVLQAKTRTFLDNNLSGHGFIHGRDGRHIDRTDLRLKVRVKHRIQELEELRASLPYVAITTISPPVQEEASAPMSTFDCFVSYAGEDRATVTSLVDALTARGVRVWWDKGQIKLGDSLMKKIEEGLSYSRYGLVMVSPYFIAKKWPESELRALHARAVSSNRKVLLPILIGMDHEQFSKTYPLLADIVTTTFASDVNALVAEIGDAMRSG